MRLRRTPEVVFIEDLSIERGNKVLTLLNQLQQERQPEAENLAQENEHSFNQDEELSAKD